MPSSKAVGVRDMGDGEIVLSCMAGDGVRRGYDIEQQASRPRRWPTLTEGAARMIRRQLLRTTVCTLLTLCTALGQAARAHGKTPSEADASTLSEVVVEATMPRDNRTLKQAAKKFVESRATLNPRSAQISHWVIPVCPTTRGLYSRDDQYVSNRILLVAHEVGAPASTARNCRANAWILFTRDPQPQLDLVARKRPTLLGYTNGSLKQLATVRYPIQAWYVTGTAGVNDAVGALDSPFNLIWNNEGRYPSRLTDVVSQIGSVLVVVNAAKVADYSLETIADYVAMVVLTKTALNGCNIFPSIIDLLSPDCGSRKRPESLTDADKAFLKALYGAQFGMRVNFEQGEISHDLLHTTGR